jgi:hypothetical protein
MLQNGCWWCGGKVCYIKETGANPFKIFKPQEYKCDMLKAA